MNSAISTESKQICECCHQTKLCKMYVLQTGNTAWICKDCREPKKFNGDSWDNGQD